jgi:hypothetical protein
MKMNLKKALSISLCATTLSLSSLYAIPAYAEEATETQSEQQKTTEPGVWHPIKFETTQTPKVTTIPKDHVYIPKDTVLNVELTQEITSKTAHVGDVVPLKLSDNVIINDIIVIPAGTSINAKVTKATSSGMFGRAGKLEFTIDSVKSLNGVNIPLKYTTIKEAGSDDGAVAVVAVVSIIGGMFMKGKNVNFPTGSKFAAKVTADTDLNVTFNELADTMSLSKPHGTEIILSQ